MLSVDIIKKFIEYHIDMTRRVWTRLIRLQKNNFFKMMLTRAVPSAI